MVRWFNFSLAHDRPWAVLSETTEIRVSGNAALRTNAHASGSKEPPER